MTAPELIEQLRTLRSLVQSTGFNQEAFDLWREIKSDFRAEHRLRLIIAWSKSVDADASDQFTAACENVLEDLEAEV